MDENVLLKVSMPNALTDKYVTPVKYSNSLKLLISVFPLKVVPRAFI